MARKVKHYRYETADGKTYLLVAVPVDFGRLVEDRTLDPPVTTEGVYLVVVSDDAYVETDPVGWWPFDKAVMFAHFYVREHIDGIRDKSVLKERSVREEVQEAVRKIRPDLIDDDSPAAVAGARVALDADAATDVDPAPSAGATRAASKPRTEPPRR